MLSFNTLFILKKKKIVNVKVKCQVCRQNSVGEKEVKKNS